MKTHNLKIEISDYPEDVKDLIEYTRLKKKYTEFDKELRTRFGYVKDFITIEQMYRLLSQLRAKEKDNERNN
jgi:hypothetical protein